MRQKKRSRKRTKYQKKRQTTARKRKRQYGGFLNHYDFAYAGRDKVNQAAKVAPGVIKTATNDINKIAEERINQVINPSGKELERVLPKILRGAIKDLYQIPFRLLGNFDKKQFNSIKRKILK